MKQRKIIGMLVITLMAALALGGTTVYAANNSYILGITNIREAPTPENSEDKRLGGAYEIQPNGDTKKVWKIVSYPTAESTKIDYSNAFYCIKAEHGFMTPTAGTDVSTIRKTYSTRFDMKREKDAVLERLQSMDVFKVDETSYNKILWIMDNMYLPKAENAEEFKEALLTKAGIITDIIKLENVRITDDDIEVVQQMALWYFTNYDDVEDVDNGIFNNYKNEELPELYFNNWSGKDEGYQNAGNGYFD